MKRTLVMAMASTALALGTAALAQTPAKLLPAQSEIAFVSKQMGVPVDGVFKKFDAQISLDPKKPEAGSVAFTIDTGSASLGIPQTDAELPKPEWFNAPKFPQASFQSLAIKGLGGGKFEVAGKLTIKGSVRDIVVPVNVVQSAGASVASGAFTIKRLEFRIGEGDWGDTSIVANEVQVRFKLALSGLAPL